MTIPTGELKALRQSLLDRLAALRDLQDSTAESRKPVELDQTSVGRLSRVDAMQRQAMALEVERRRGQEKLRIEAALRRVDAGDFGYCIACGEAIASKRLAIDPTVPTCIRCASEAPR
ncbi:MAG: TraR/DksA C4-type zinc finger protein [Reyranella sp.]|uniref:TraR/DksA family transcriptional regulator n=1 Tax=Reyranella sp. TaxID=1929291 RepID=UPI00272F4E36|nr:TraR/DksA C4-type zinc finger protein [Reyranella sp.]MDP1966434.1 TraR/DksA C4-type zinc finger protein [Reyranella sp.]MDP2375849.1 TraR/DksA C4-type zinc finger protein [Reyranella sp.]